jgi:hypothetical protein
MYRNPPRTRSAPSPIRNILASQFIAATPNSQCRSNRSGTKKPRSEAGAFQLLVEVTSALSGVPHWELWRKSHSDKNTAAGHRPQRGPRKPLGVAGRAGALRTEGSGGQAQSPNAPNGGLGWLPLDGSRPRDTPLWNLEAALKCRSGRYAPPVHMIPRCPRSRRVFGCIRTRRR